MDGETVPDAPDVDAIRFEDLTVDDDMPIIDRIVRYINSQVALQRLVHVKMLAEAAELAGSEATRLTLVPAIESLVTDPESVIRQHIAAQLLSVSIVCMIRMDGWKVQQLIDDPEISKQYDEEGYKIVTSTLVNHLNTLIADADIDVRRSAVASLSGLALQLEPEDVPGFCLPVPLKLAYQKPSNPSSKKKSEADQKIEELRITAANLLAELGGAASEHKALHAEAHWVGAQVLPAVMELCGDSSFRVRRSGVQALPRILGACSFEDVSTKILPTFEALSQDGVHRIRKSVGECLVDMSRSLMILAAAQQNEPNKRAEICELRRTKLIPIADRLIQDSHKMVRQGMMQFLGPFIASFYPYQFSPLHTALPTSTESDGSNHMGIVAQFFPHATSMVSRLNSSQNSITTAPTPVHSSLEQLSPKDLSDVERLKHALPLFVHAGRMSILSLNGVATHREKYPPDRADVEAIMDNLLDYFAALAIVTTGDENTDAEMRVYCAYSFPAVVLLLGPENWEGPLKTCFMSLLNSNYGKAPEAQGEAVEPPLPVKRCLASSLQTVARILGSASTSTDIIPAFRDYFLKDSDESVRLNVIRNFPSILQVLPASERREPFVLWSEVVRGEEFLGAKKRSATNPLVLNWRQRDYLARSLPDMFGLVDPSLCYEHLWPMLQQLLVDTVSTVREDAMWSIPIMLKAFCPESLKSWQKNSSNSKAISPEVCTEICQWMKDRILRLNQSGSRAKVANFSDRQLYCRICAAVGLALRFSEDFEATEEERSDPVSLLSEKFRPLLDATKSGDPQTGPYQRMTSAEEKHVKSLLVKEMLAPALAMKEDRTSNVRVTLMKVLQVMPEDIQSLPECKPVLKDLVEETETWESFGPEPPSLAPNARKKPERKKQEVVRKAPPPPPGPPGPPGPPPGPPPAPPEQGPVDVDEVSVTPQSSRDEDDKNHNHDAQGDQGDDGSSDSDKSSVSDSPSLEDQSEWKTVIFEDGPIGMQLEPTTEDRACRVFSFLETGPGSPSPAQESGLVNTGDVIVSVNGVTVESYDETIALLKAGGRREVTFRPGREEDLYDDSQSEDLAYNLSQSSLTNDAPVVYTDDEGDDDDKYSDRRDKKDDKSEKSEKKSKKKKKEKSEKKEKKSKKDSKKDEKKKKKESKKPKKESKHKE